MKNYTEMSQAIKSLREVYPKFLEAIQDSRCDKHGFGFQKDNRFSMVSIKLSLDSWTGYYGSSSCSTFGSVGDREIFTEYFVAWLNRKFPQILQEIADDIEKDSTEAKNKRIAELQEELQELQK